MLHSSPRLTTNSFDLLRLLFAGTVCLVHAYDLSGYEQLAWTATVLSSSLAVKAFFVASGFLIFMSYERSSSIASYAQKRLRRIYPAYFTVVALCAIGLVGVSSRDLAGYFTDDWLKYVAANLSFLNFLHPTLPGVFETNTRPEVNGALWTLKVEAMFYLSVPVFVALFRRFGHLRVIALAYVLSVAYTAFCLWSARRTGSGLYLELARQLPGQLCYFMAGAVFYYQLPFFERRAHHLVAGALLVLAANAYWPQPVLEPLALATVVIFVALFLHVGNFAKYGDFSYGLYILHFPVIQCFIHFGWLASHPWLFLVSVVLTTTLAAVAMWHLVEKRFLSRKSHYLAASVEQVPHHGRGCESA